MMTSLESQNVCLSRRVEVIVFFSDGFIQIPTFEWRITPGSPLRGVFENGDVISE